MRWEGNLRKMETELQETVRYDLPLYNILEEGEFVHLNPFIGKEVHIEFLHEIHCVVTGKKIKKTFGEGMSYDAFQNSPEASPSIIRPELSRIHEGIALRDFEYEMKHHMTPHTVYLAQTADVKVGVTRNLQIPTRWIDQGAEQAIRLAETPYRQAAGLIEVALKDFISDKTNWQQMLKGGHEKADLLALKSEMAQHVPDNLSQYISSNDSITEIHYPLLANPAKVTSLKLDKSPLIEKKLIGIKGQYLIFEDGSVINIRSHSGYKIAFEA
ncbi:MAG: DUF2797 domain-containing protein [Bacteroidetes bacterium]|nr:DUF2797 domain-containing protein [Bacteroidota bacterium]